MNLADTVYQNTMKHLSGQHDQKTHGNWAGNPKLRTGRPSRSSITTFRKMVGGISREPVTNELRAIIGGITEWGEGDNIQGWANYIEERTGLKVLDFTESIEVVGREISGYSDALGIQYEHDNSIDIVSFEPDGEIIQDTFTEKIRYPAAAVFIHEIGHCIYSRCWFRGNKGIERYINKLQGEDHFDQFTQYAKTNIQESFAESFVLYLIAGGKKRVRTEIPRHAERVFRVIDQVIKEHEQFLQSEGQSLKHLSGQHDQKTHGSWAERLARANRLRNKIDYNMGKHILSGGIGREDALMFNSDEWGATLANSAVREKVKDAICRNLSGVSWQGISPKLKNTRERFEYAQANRILGSWAASSNKNVESKILQQAIQEEFESELSGWQKDGQGSNGLISELSALAEISENYTRRVADIYDSMTGIDPDSITQEARNQFKKDLDKAKQDCLYSLMSASTNTNGAKNYAGDLFSELKEGNSSKMMDAVFPFNRFSVKTARRFLRKMYDQTQAKLKEAGYKENDLVSVFRGITDVEINPKIGEKIKWVGNAAESWSVSHEVAKLFGINPGGMTLFAKIPAKQILCTCRTGLGALPEMEVVVLNGFYPIEATVIEKYKGGV